jgi:hypothetical protein
MSALSAVGTGRPFKAIVPRVYLTQKRGGSSGGCGNNDSKNEV